MSEIWKPIPGFEGRYEASSEGSIKTIKRPFVPNDKVKAMCLGNAGYLMTVLVDENGVKKTVNVHRIIALTFLGSPPLRHDVNHKNGIKTDNRVENLEYLTRSENLTHSYRELNRSSPGRSFYNGTHHRSTLAVEQVIEMRALFDDGWKTRDLMRKFNVSQNCVYSIVKRLTWKDV